MDHDHNLMSIVIILGPVVNTESLRTWMRIKDDFDILQDVCHEKQCVRSMVYMSI